MAKNLSKSRYRLFRQCPKALWMSVYQPESAAEADQTRMTEGNRVGELAMHGSFSIKKVLPALFPDDEKLNYANLQGSVHNGGEAMDIFPRMRTMPQDQLEAARASLLEYCKLDTWSMVVILRKLYEITK